MRWGITPNLTLNGTVNPDLSQVESDAGQFSFDPRLALFFPEKRPFFLDSIEQFSTPNNLIYTRRVVAPVAATKITGKISGRTSLAYLAAVDDASLSVSGEDHPVFNILRVQQDIGAKSRAALVYTDRMDGSRSNRVVASDARFVWKDIYSMTLQGALSRTATSRTETTAPLWQGVFARSGRRFQARYTFRGIDPDFRAAAGFISRTGVASANLNHTLVTYGRPGSALERWSSDVVVDASWVYDDLMAGLPSQDRKLHFNNNFAFKGGWRLGGSVLIESFGYVIEPWNAKTVEAELKKRGLTPVADNDGKGFESFHVKDPDGFDVQICNTKARKLSGANGKIAAPAPFEPTGWNSIWLDHISFQCTSYKESAAWYAALLGWKLGEDEGSQNEAQIGDVGGIIIRGGNANAPGGLAAGRGGRGNADSAAGGPPAPVVRRTVINHVAFGIAGFDPDKVLAELQKRGLTARADTGGPRDIHEAPYKSYHTTTPNGYDLQISNGTRETRTVR